MDLTSFLSNLITSTAHTPVFAALAIILGTFIHEDITTVTTGILVADGILGTGVALPALYIGIVLGDFGLYGLGRLIALNRYFKRFAQQERLTAFKIWLDERLVAGVFLVRFIPGLRFPAYTTYGFFEMSFKRYFVSVILAASIWTTGLFYLSVEFGALTEHWLGLWRWPIIVVAVMLPFIVVERMMSGRVPGSKNKKQPPDFSGG